MIARNWFIKESMIMNGQIILTPLNDILPLTNLCTWGIKGRFTVEEEPWIIIRASLPMDLIVTLRDSLEDGTDPLSLEALNQLNISHLYAGQTDTELYYIANKTWGIDLNTTYDTGMIDEFDKPIMEAIVKTVTICGENNT